MITMKVTIHNQTNMPIVDIEKLIKRIFKRIHEVEGMQLIFVDANEIRRLNKTYRNIDHVTDVLTFINDEPDDHSLGDVFICLDQAEKQRTTYGHSFNREVGFLAVHGYLHLKGYDHHTTEEEKIMIKKQEEILKKARLERSLEDE